MKKRKFGLAMASLLAVGTLLGACGAKEEVGGEKVTSTGNTTRLVMKAPSQ